MNRAQTDFLSRGAQSNSAGPPRNTDEERAAALKCLERLGALDLAGMLGLERQ